MSLGSTATSRSRCFPDISPLPESVERVILKALAKAPKDRYPRTTALAQALEDAIEGNLEVEELETEMPLTLPPTIVKGEHAIEPPAVEEPLQEKITAPEDQEPERKTPVPRWAWGLAGVGVLVVIALIAILSRDPLQAVAEDSTITSTLQPATEAPTSVPSPSQAPPETALPVLGVGSTMDSPTDGVRLVYVLKGEFSMGAGDSDPDASSNEKPEHTAFLDAFWLDQAEVTNRMYRQCVNAGACDSPARRSEFDQPDLTDHPVVWVSRRDAEDYCQWAGRRLPTEAEWEKAARGAEGRTFPWGSGAVAGHLLNFADVNLNEEWADPSVDDGFEYSSPVGNYAAGASPYGALDLAGNVWEWVSDWFDPQYNLDSTADNPAGPASSPAGTYTVRGGSFLSDARNVRAAYRYGYSPDTSAADLGFRCAVSASAVP
ncbi:MAG: SUMF1/EgtB/PvdO family nonheme iron enzyme [Anaerolineales bacterium]